METALPKPFASKTYVRPQTSFSIPVKIMICSGDPEIGPPMGLTESGPILESVRFVKPATFKSRDTSQSVHR